MNRRFSTNFAVFIFLSDLGTLIGVLLVEKYGILIIQDYQSFFGKEGLPWPFFFIVIPVWIIFGILFSIYDGRKTQKIIDELTSLTLCYILFAFTNSGILYFSYRDISRKLFIIFLVASYLTMLVFRLLYRVLYRRHLTHRHFIPRVLIIGAGNIGNDIKGKFSQNQNSSLKFIGYLDDDPKKQGLPQVLGPTHTVHEMIRTHRVDVVIIALPGRAYERTAQLVKELNETAVKVYIVPDYFNWALYHLDISDFSGVPMIDLRSPAINEYQRITKRLFDIIFSAIFIILSSPIMIAIAIAIKISDGGPIFFVQNRIGENGHIIKIYKFRSMVVNAEKLMTEVSKVDKAGNLIHKLRGDPRITKVGKVIRRFSLDELPQFINILNGTLSLVGPRPELPELVKKYEPWQRKRFSVPQGLTGWWQIKGRSDRPMHLNTEDDLYYIQHYSIWLDIYILIKTFWVVIRGHGAY